MAINFADIPSRYAQARLLPTLTLRPSGFLYNTRNAESYSLNPTAACLVEALLRGVLPDELWQKLCERFAVDEPRAHCDTLQFLSALHELKLLELPQDPDEEEDDDEDQDADEDQDPGDHADSQGRQRERR